MSLLVSPVNTWVSSGVSGLKGEGTVDDAWNSRTDNGLVSCESELIVCFYTKAQF